jgi:heptosyltransferase-2
VRLAHTLSARPIDEALILAPSFRSALLPVLAKARRRVGRSGEVRAVLLTDAIPAAGRDRHLARQYLDLAAQLGAEPQAPLDPLLPIGTDEREYAALLLASIGVKGSECIALCPGATYGETKRWPLVRWIELARILGGRGWKLLILGGKKESDLGRRIAEPVGNRVRDMSGKLSIRGSLATMASLAGAVSNDSGAMHLAAAAGCPVIGLFGSTNPDWTGPLGERSRVIGLGLPCSPCYARTCPTEIECLRDLTAARVAEETDRLIEDGPRRIG